MALVLDVTSITSVRSQTGIHSKSNTIDIIHFTHVVISRDRTASIIDGIIRTIIIIYELCSIIASVISRVFESFYSGISSLCSAYQRRKLYLCAL